MPLGLPTPPSAGKRRIAFMAPHGAVAGVRAAVALDCVLAVGCFPSAWRATLAAVDGAAARLGLRTRVFGSLMWQYLSGLPYVTEASDVDLLWLLPAGSAGGCDALLQALLRIDAQQGPRIDGEIVANGAAVQWRELAAAGRDDLLMVKTAGDARLYPRRRWLAGEARA
ncbi:malonate decarboxylase holo-[acyl-carrier-protein] synthase [Bordetella sp. H567]|uniref:malonate decarboxylase holo-[acyl-carrier-protein] synthase n=1 Tax=Bordetella sp. H567 TaxID=1697043 RepID=UPI0026D53EC8